jgi:hypothetical protein
VELALDRAVDRAEPFLDRCRGVRLVSGDRVDEEQLLFDAERERLSGAEGVVGLLVRRQA